MLTSFELPLFGQAFESIEYMHVVISLFRSFEHLRYETQGDSYDI